MSLNIDEVEKTNETLMNNYKKVPAPPGRKEILVSKLMENTIVNILISLGIGFGLIIFISFFYSFGTGQTFSMFLKENPEIVIIGGVTLFGIVYRIAFWKGK